MNIGFPNGSEKREGQQSSCDEVTRGLGSRDIEEWEEMELKEERVRSGKLIGEMIENKIIGGR